MGLGIVALLFISIPFAATRLILPFAWFSIGGFLFRGLAFTSIRPLSWILLFILMFACAVSSSPKLFL